MRYSYNDILGMSQDIFLVIMFFGVLLFVFMIYVGICVVKIKNDLRKLTELELEKNKDRTIETNTSNDNAS
jgi:hypothetical protein